MKDLVIGSAYNLNWEQCRLWVKSLELSGFDGDKAIVIFGENNLLAKSFSDHNFKIISVRNLNPDEHICSARFAVYHSYLNSPEVKGKYDKVIATDVTDVFFQKNPSEFLHSQDIVPHYGLVASSENIRYKDEHWGANNVRASFGDEAYEKIMNNEIYNAGVIAGSQSMFAELSFLIYNLCLGRPQHVPGGGGPDQAAYNILLNKFVKQSTTYMSHNDGWACQVGTVADPKKDYSKFNVEPNPVFENGVAKTTTNIPYYIIHQYNRNPVWNAAIKERYNV
jgi:hypothetical protein